MLLAKTTWGVFTMTILILSTLVALMALYSMFKGRKVRTMNPWGSASLEWTTPINPGHGNWEGEIPEVHRWPYDYGKDGREFIPQTEPISANESKH